MKKLLDRSLRPLIVYALLVLVLSIPFYFLIINFIWVRELDKHHYAIRQKIENRIRELAMPDSSIQSTVAILNKIQPGFSFRAVEEAGKDSLYNIIRFDTFMQDREQFRCLVTYIHIDDSVYRLLIETNMEEIDETILAIASITVVLLVLLLTGFIFLNRRMSQKVWRPFYRSLHQVKSFRLDAGHLIHFEKTDILEFEGLNQSLEKLIAGNLASYRRQREFTENASHELQTPLAIVKLKLDLLLQSKSLTGDQLHIIEDANQAINRVSRINKNLLLLAKIDNAQFENTELINFSDLMVNNLEQFSDHFLNKGLPLSQQIQPGITIQGNRVLAEILLTNLLINAVRYTPDQGTVRVVLSETGFTISNTGPGSLDTDNLFMRFARGSSQHPGSGLGLAIVKEICNRYGWQISYSFLDGKHVFALSF